MTDNDNTQAETPTETPTETPAGSSETPRWRRVVSIVLLVVGFILIPLSAVALWSRNQLLNTDRYVETVSPLAGNADIQAAVATATVNALFAQVDAKSKIESALPSRADFLGAPLTTAIENYAIKVANKLLASSEFQKLWDGANRRAHTQLVALLTDDPGKNQGSLAIKNGAVTLDISNVVTKVQGRLVSAGLSFLSKVKVPPVSATVKIIDSEGLSEARGYVSLLNTLAWVLPVLGFGALIASALIVRTRRRATIRAALVLIGACAFTLVLLAVGRSFYVDAVKSANKDAASAMFDILMRNLRYGLITVAVLGIVIAIAAYFIGPSAAAVKARSWASSGIGGARSRAQEAGYEGGPIAQFAGRHRRGLEITVVGVIVLVFLAWNRPGVGTVVFLAVVCLVLIGVVEFLARDAGAETVAEME
ncbi:MAG: hypothetical protein ACHQDE_04055, partial [Acidimicrobiia bacterium]